MVEFLVIAAVASLLYRMKNLLGLIIRLNIYGLIVYVVFSDSIKGWDTKALYVAILSIPILINFLLGYLKLKVLRT